MILFVSFESSRYENGEMIGGGAFGKVHQCLRNPKLCKKTHQPEKNDFLEKEVEKDGLVQLTRQGCCFETGLHRTDDLNDVTVENDSVYSQSCLQLPC